MSGNSLGHLMRRAREATRLSHRELAKKARRSTSTAVRAEAGRGTIQTFRDLLRPTGWKLVVLTEGKPTAHLGRALAAARLRAGFSYTAVAVKSGLSLQAVYDCERDFATSTASTVQRLLRALRLRVTLAR